MTGSDEDEDWNGSSSSLLSIIDAYYDEEHDDDASQLPGFAPVQQPLHDHQKVCRSSGGDNRAGAVLPTPPEKPFPIPLFDRTSSPQVVRVAQSFGNLRGNDTKRITSRLSYDLDMSKGFFRRLFGGGSSSSQGKEKPQEKEIPSSAPRLDVVLTDLEEDIQSEKEDPLNPLMFGTPLTKTTTATTTTTVKHVPPNLRVSVPRKPVQRLNLEPASPLMPKIEGGLPIGLGIKTSLSKLSEVDTPKEEDEEEDVFHDIIKEERDDDASTLEGNGSDAIRPVSTYTDMSPVPEVISVTTTNTTNTSSTKNSPYLNNTRKNVWSASSPNLAQQKPEITALKLYEGTAALAQDEYAAWMGDEGEEQSHVRRAYMGLFEFNGKSILAALRMLCDRLYMKGESQQLNRVIEAFSNAWTEKNPNHGFYDSTVVYTISYALILLNTDIYAADHSVTKKMSKTKFVWNTMETIRNHTSKEIVAEPPRTTSAFGHRPDEFESTPANKRSSLNLSGDTNTFVSSCPLPVLSREWEMQVESVLKVFYSSVAKEALKLHLVETPPSSIPANIYSTNLAPIASQTPSVRSSAVSSSLFSRMRFKKHNNYENQSRISSLAVDRSSESFRRNSMNSTFSFESNFSSLGRHAVGFAGILWNSMIREESPISSITDGEDDVFDEDTFADFARIEAELAKEVELELHGAPWVKEGLLKYRAFIDPNTGKKAKKKDWVEVFTVVQRGQIKIFQFDTKSSSSSHVPLGGVVGGGNWMENANLVDGFHLCHTLAQELPPAKKSKGYNALWSLTLPQRGLLVFQAGTPEIAREFVYTCNYWAGRLSKEPFEEPVSSVEYGWGVACTAAQSSTNSLIRTIPKSSSSRNLGQKKSFAHHQATHSITGGTGGVSGPGRSPKLSRSPSLTFRSKYESRYEQLERPGDKLVIKEWRPTGHSMIVSDLNEEKQLENLRSYVVNAEEKLEDHNLLRPKLRYAFTPGTPNWHKAHNNWEHKSQHLLQQVVRYKVYVEHLQCGIASKKQRPSPSSNSDKNSNSLDGSGAVAEQVIHYTDSDDSDNDEMVTPTAELFDSEQTLQAPQGDEAKLGSEFVPQTRCFQAEA
ncbi:hypothetical protein TRVA0_023S00804 [Trichomonascus vanleenenianus]|uniref:Sec7 domain-containing protein n=1 Tax=Trichomonascus vanleenenianus TaxID=2268995 RepID=UPI003ECB5285